MKIVFFNRFFFPDLSATSQILSDLAFHLARDGNDVHVVTSRVPGAEQSLEVVEGVSVHRVATATVVPHGLASRALAYLAYYRGALGAVRSIVEKGDIVVLKTDPPLLSAVIGPLAKSRGAKLVLWLQDLFPEVAREYGIPGMSGVTGAMIRRWRDKSIVAADCTVGISDHMVGRIASYRCVSRDRLHVIHNWADGKAISPIDRAANPLRKAWNLESAFVVAYSGNLGRVHEFDTVLAAAARLRAVSEIHFLIVGRGPQLDEVRKRAEQGGLANIRFEPHQGRELLSQSLGVADVHLVVLRPEFEGLVHPSKLYGVMAAGRPTIFIGDVTGETSSILKETGAGLSVATGDAAALSDAIRMLRDDGAERLRMGNRARRAFETRYDMPIALARWAALLRSLGSAPPAPTREGRISD